MNINGELPVIAKTAYGTTSSVLAFNDHQLVPIGAAHVNAKQHVFGDQDRWDELQRRVGAINAAGLNDARIGVNNAVRKEVPMTARIVRVFIADANENIPLDKRVIYKSDEKLTDMTDQELFYEANPAALLAAHNEYRITVLDKKATTAAGERVMLEPARIRDLKMVVVDVAVF